MTKAIVAGTLAAVLGCVVVSGSSAQGGSAAVPQRAVQILKENVEWVRDNARIYQWMRVNREVDRIQSSERAIRKALTANAALTGKVETLHKAVSELGKARRARDIDRILAAANQVDTAVADLVR